MAISARSLSGRYFSTSRSSTAFLLVHRKSNHLMTRFSRSLDTCRPDRKLSVASWGGVRVLGSTNLPEAHVLFDGVDAGLELGSGGVHVGDHGAHVPHDGGEDQHAHLGGEGSNQPIRKVGRGLG